MFKTSEWKRTFSSNNYSNICDHVQTPFIQKGLNILETNKPKEKRNTEEHRQKTTILANTLQSFSAICSEVNTICYEQYLVFFNLHFTRNKNPRWWRPFKIDRTKHDEIHRRRCSWKRKERYSKGRKKEELERINEKKMAVNKFKVEVRAAVVVDRFEKL